MIPRTPLMQSKPRLLALLLTLLAVQPLAQADAAAAGWGLPQGAAADPTAAAASSQAVPGLDAVGGAAELGTLMSGAAAVARLQQQQQLAVVAQSYNMSAPQLASLLQQDADLRVHTGQGKLLYVCSGLDADNAAVAAQKAGVAVQRPPAGQPHKHHKHRKLLMDAWNPEAKDPLLTQVNFSETGVPLLHSRVGASLRVYLDFDGHVTSGTQWNQGCASCVCNATGNSCDVITTPPFDYDGVEGFSEVEQSMMISIWRQVAEDYSVWQVDVTTEDPGEDALRRTSRDDTQYGVHVAVGGNCGDWFIGGCGGIAFVNAFDYILPPGASPIPAFIFAKNLGPNLPRFMAEAASHEIGHTLGLHHDGIVGGPEYYPGQGVWAPIMGISYYKPVTQWSKGEYADASNTEDDIAIISDKLPPVADEYGNIPAGAQLITSSRNSYVRGLINSGRDADIFRIEADVGALVVKVALVPAWVPEVPAWVGLVCTCRTNLDLRVQLSSPTALLAQRNALAIDPFNCPGLPVNLAYNIVTPGTYYISLRAAGYLDPGVRGYSSYGSIGSYAFTATFKPLAKSKASAAAAAAAAVATAPDGGVVELQADPRP